jgi:TIR domain
MAYLAPHSTHDVFVSYSHGDPRGKGDSPLRRWTVRLIQELEEEIRSLDDEFDNLDVWCDENIDPTAQLTAELRDRVKSSGILVVVISKRYLSSSWCKDELAWFREQVVARSDEQGRIFVVRVQPTNEADWPEFLRDERGNSQVGYRFYDPQTGMPYGWGDVRDTSGDYVKQLWGLQTKLTRRLRELRQRAESRAAVSTLPPAPPGTGNRIYLHARAEDAPARDEVRKQLAEAGLMPLTPPPDAGSTIGDFVRESKARVETAKRCAAMALVRTGDNESFIDDLLDIGVDERLRIQAARGAPLPCAILDRSGTSLPIDVTPYGIRLFDLGRQNWRGEFRAWVDAAPLESAAR